MSKLQQIYNDIVNHKANAGMRAKGYQPIYTAHQKAKIVIVGQAPGIKAQQSHKPWNDASGQKLREWLGVSDEQLYDPKLFALIPMDFYYPGKGTHGDKPPRKGFAAKWHPQLLQQMPGVRLIILVGAYAQKYYLGPNAKPNLTQTVQAYKAYLPKFLPIVHPSPLNFRWQTRNPWFQKQLVPSLQKHVSNILG